MKRETELTKELIFDVVCDFYKENPETVRSKSQNGHVVMVRHIIIFFCRELLKELAQETIGLLFHGRNEHLNHTSCVHAVKTVNNMIATDLFYARNIEKLRKEIDRITNPVKVMDVIDQRQSEILKRISNLESMVNDKTKIIYMIDREFRNIAAFMSIGEVMEKTGLKKGTVTSMLTRGSFSDQGFYLSYKPGKYELPPFGDSESVFQENDLQ